MELPFNVVDISGHVRIVVLRKVNYYDKKWDYRTLVRNLNYDSDTEKEIQKLRDKDWLVYTDTHGEVDK